MNKANILTMQNHYCAKVIRVTERKGRKEANDSIILADDLIFYEVISDEGKFFNCNRIKTDKFVDEETPELNYDAIFLRRFVKVIKSDKLFTVEKKNVKCKGVLVGDLLYAVSFTSLFV